ncbi:MAG: NAD(P)-dependent oxidoreductase [Sideroxydans sp.]|nr:NAD(P)-dependent oxidoreductase [Sideroxydans sp.]
MKKKILLTGVTGFLGSHLAIAILAAGYKVIALKRKSSSLTRIQSIVSDIEIIDIDGIDFDCLFRDYGKIDAIIHTATCYGRNNESVSEIFAANTEFPLHLLDAGSRAGVKIFLNTDTILDQYLNLYALSKNQFLQWGKFFAKQGNIRFGNIRLEHFYGPDDEPTKFTAHVINTCLNNFPELKLTKGEQKRDFIYIDDVVTAYLILLEEMSKLDRAFVEFDVGSGRSVSIKEFVETVHRITGSKTYLDFGALPYREGEVMHSDADISGLVALGWRCYFDVEAGLNKVIEQERKKL